MFQQFAVFVCCDDIDSELDKLDDKKTPQTLIDEILSIWDKKACY